MIEPIEKHKQTINLLEEIIEFHSDFLEALTEDERDVLSRYYFAGREVDVDDLGQYRDKLVVDEPCIEAKAQEVLAKFKAVAKLQ